MAAAISGFTPTTPPATASSTTTGLNGMTSSDFLNLMIQQLQQQDPMNPTDSSQLLTQMSQISNLQSNSAMVTSLSSLTLQQSIGSAGNLIGKTINGIDDNGNQLQGVVTSVKVVNKKVRLELDSGNDLPMENVTQIAGTSAANLANLAAAFPQLQQLLGSTTTTPATTAATTPVATTATTPIISTDTTAGSKPTLTTIPGLLSAMGLR
jgi:Flagellar hook capping protein - N-terminal region